MIHFHARRAYYLDTANVKKQNIKRDSARTFDGQFTVNLRCEYFGRCIDLKPFGNPFFSYTRTRISSKPSPLSSFNTFFNRTSKPYNGYRDC